MSEHPTHQQLGDGIWFVYDGDCPLCRSAATALRIKAEYGALRLLNARDGTDHPLMAEINRRRLDLDEGMVIYDGAQFYHGRSALRFMARFGEDTGLFNRVTRLLFRSEQAARLAYPSMRGTRNLLLRLLGRGKIRNLEPR